MDKKLRVGVLISGGGSNLSAILDTCEAGRIDAKISLVGSDNPNAGGLKRADEHGIPSFVIDYGSIIHQFKHDPNLLTLPKDMNLDDIIKKQHLIDSRANPNKIRQFLLPRIAAEYQLLKTIQPYHLDLLVLAGFMRNLTPYFIDRFNLIPDEPRIMNIHPALLPAFPGLDGYGDTMRYGCKIGGCTVHFIDYGEDSGPIITQKAFYIEENDSIESIKQKGLKLEWETYPQCIQLFAEGRLKVIRMTHKLKNGRLYQRRVVKIAQPLF
jgi:phosphoribosylglycinamide formyltransferase 1